MLGRWNFKEALIGNVHTYVSVPSPPVLEETYTAQACRIVFECLRLLAFCLRAALTAKLEEGGTVFSRHALHCCSISSSCEMLTVKFDVCIRRLQERQGQI